MRHIRFRWFWSSAAAIAFAGAALGAQASGASTSASGIYSAEQAARGATLFVERCSACHKVDQFTGPEFLLIWGGQPALGLFTLIRTTMPQGSPASLTRQQYADILAYLLRENGLAAGSTELAGTDAALKKVVIPARDESAR